MREIAVKKLVPLGLVLLLSLGSIPAFAQGEAEEARLAELRRAEHLPAERQVGQRAASVTRRSHLTYPRTTQLALPTRRGDPRLRETPGR
jgi:hypothetical protein